MIANPWMAIGCWTISALVTALVVDGGELDPVAVYLLLHASALVVFPVVWVGRRGALWLLLPWRRFRYSRVAYFDLRDGHWIQAELISGGRRGAIPHAFGYLETSERADRRNRRMVEMLEQARVASGGNRAPERRVRPRTPLGEEAWPGD